MINPVCDFFFFCKQLLQIGLNWEIQLSPFKVCANISKDFAE